MKKLDLGHVAELLKKGDASTLKRFKETQLSTSDDCKNYEHYATVDQKLQYTKDGYLNFEFTITPKEPGIVICNMYGISSGDNTIAGTLNSNIDSESSVKTSQANQFSGLLSAPYQPKGEEIITANFYGTILFNGKTKGICFSSSIDIQS